MTHEQLQDAHIAALREIVELRAEVGRARGTASYWKAEHLEANKEIERLKAQLATANERVTRMRSLLQRAQTIITLDADIYTIWREDAGEELVK